MNSEEANTWLKANCQRAANDFLRLQSAVLKRLPVPASLAVASPRGAARGPIHRRIPGAPGLLLASKPGAGQAPPWEGAKVGDGDLAAPGTAG